MAIALAIALLARLVLSGSLAVLGYLVAAGAFAYAARGAPGLDQVPWRTRNVHLTLFALSVALMVSLLVHVTSGTVFPAWGVALGAWMLAVGAYVLAWYRQRDAIAAAMRCWSLSPAECVLAICLFALALLLRTVALDQFPWVLGGDEGMAAMNARAVLQGNPVSPFGTVSLGLGRFPSLYFFGEAAFMCLFGDDVAGSRVWSGLVGAAAVLCVYLLGRQWFSPRVAAAAALVMATFPQHLYWSRSPMNNVADALGVAATLLFVTRAFASGRPGHYALAGVTLGLAQYGYQSARLLVPLVVLLAAREAILDRGWIVRHRFHLSILAGGVLVAFLPLAVFFADDPHEFFGRLGQVSILRSDWLNQQMASSGQSAPQVVLEHLSKTFQVFHGITPRGFFEPQRPLLDPLSGALFLFGVVLVLAALRDRSSFALMSALFAFLVGAGLTENPPNEARLIGITPLIALVVAIGLVRAASLLASDQRWGTILQISVLAALIAAQGIQFYFFEYGNSPRYQHVNVQAATELAYYLRDLPPGSRVLFLAQPRMSCTSHASVQFIAAGRICVDLPTDVDPGIQPALEPGMTVVALPERLVEAQQMVVSARQVQVRELSPPGSTGPSIIVFEPVAP